MKCKQLRLIRCMLTTLVKSLKKMYRQSIPFSLPHHPHAAGPEKMFDKGSHMHLLFPVYLVELPGEFGLKSYSVGLLQWQEYLFEFK